MSHVLELSRAQQAKYYLQKRASRELLDAGIRSDVPQVDGASDARVSEEMLGFLGVKPMKIFPTSEDLTEFPEQKIVLEKIIEVSHGAERLESKLGANILFLPGSGERKFRGMWDFSKEFATGIAGMAITPPRREDRGEVTTDEMWNTLGYSFTPYSVHPIANWEGNITRVVPGSMEGALSDTDVTRGWEEVAERIRFIGASEKVTKNKVDNTFPDDPSLHFSMATQEVIRTCFMLRKWGLMPKLDLSGYVPDKQRLEEVMKLIGTTGLSTGNASVWNRELGGMEITASGVDKGKLTHDKVLPVRFFTENFDGVVVLASKGEIPPKASVEAFDNLLNYYISLGIQSGDIKTSDIREIIAFAKDGQRVQAALKSNQPSHIRQIHFHAHPSQEAAWDPEVITVVEASRNLVPYGDANSSCGTRPLAYYTAEMIARGILATKGSPRIVVAKLPKHGSQIFSPFDIETTLHHINPNRILPKVIFAPVDMRNQNREAA